MGTKTLSPDATLSSTDWLIYTTPLTAHGVLSDNDDNTYVGPNNMANPTPLQVAFSDPSPAIPAGSRITGVGLTLRHRYGSPGISALYGWVGTPGKGEHGLTNYGSGGAGFADGTSTEAFAADGSEWELADLNALYSKIRGPGGTAAPYYSNMHVAEQSITVTYNEQPVVTVNYPLDDDTTTAGNQVTTSSTPAAGWQYTDPDGDLQERWEVRRYLQPAGGWTGFDPATTAETPVETQTNVGTSTSTQMSVVLDNNTTYRDYVRAADTTPSGFAVRWSAWAFREFTMALAQPPDPGIVVTPEGAANRVKIELTEGAVVDSDGYATTVEADGAVAYWSLSDLTARVGGYTLTNNGGATFVPGQVDDAVSLDGSTQWLSNAAFTPPMTGSWTVEGWVNLDTIGATTQRMFHKGSAGATDVAVTIGTTGRPLVFFVDTASATKQVDAPTGMEVAAGTWAYIVATWDGTTLRLYLNGLDTGNTTVPGSTPRDGGDTVRIGRSVSASPTHHLDGLIDEVAVYDRALTPTEVAEHYSVGTGATTVYSGGAPSAEYFDVERSDDGGVTWSPIRFSPVDTIGSELMEDEPVAYWRMSDLTDETGSYPLVTNPTTWTDFVADGIGTAARLDGATEWFNSGFSFDPAMTGPWQVRAMVKVDTVGATSPRIFHKGTTTSLDIGVLLTTSNRLQVSFTNSGGTQHTLLAPLATALAIDRWYVVRATWDGTTLRLYIDGVDTGTSLVPGTTPRDTGNELRIGRGTVASPANHLDGVVDEVAVYESVISPTRIAEVDSPALAVTVYDYEAPRSADGTDQQIVYRAYAVDTTEGLPISSAPVESSSVVLASDGMQWVKSTSDPTFNRSFDIVAEGSPATIDSTSEEPQGIFHAQGRSDPVVHSADIQMERFAFLVSLDDDEEREDFEALRALQETLLVQLCTGDDGLEQHYVRFGGPRTWHRIIEETQNTAQKAWYRIPATEVRGAL